MEQDVDNTVVVVMVEGMRVKKLCYQLLHCFWTIQTPSILPLSDHQIVVEQFGEIVERLESLTNIYRGISLWFSSIQLGYTRILLVHDFCR